MGIITKGIRETLRFLFSLPSYFPLPFTFVVGAIVYPFLLTLPVLLGVNIAHYLFHPEWKGILRLAPYATTLFLTMMFFGAMLVFAIPALFYFLYAIITEPVRESKYKIFTFFYYAIPIVISHILFWGLLYWLIYWYLDIPETHKNTGKWYFIFPSWPPPIPGSYIVLWNWIKEQIHWYLM